MLSLELPDRFAGLPVPRYQPGVVVPGIRDGHRGVQPVLHLLHRAVHAGPGAQPAFRRNPRGGGSAGRARVLRGDAPRPDRQRLPRPGGALRFRRAPPAHRADPGAPAPPVPDLAPALRGRLDDRGPGLRRERGALPSPSGAVRIGPRPLPDEAPLHGRRLPRAHRRERARRCRRWPSPPTSSWDSRGRPRTTSRPRSTSSAPPGFRTCSPSATRRAPEPPRPAGEAIRPCPTGSPRSASRGCWTSRPSSSARPTGRWRGASWRSSSRGPTGTAGRGGARLATGSPT